MREPEKTIIQLAAESRRYPVDAFIFVQECVGVASEQAHGAMNDAEKLVHDWMVAHHVDAEELRRRDTENELPPEVADSLDSIGGPERMNRHITGQQLCWSVRDEALRRWGLMARGVLARWNVTRTDDIGAIIFALVESDWLQKQPSDSIHDFDDVFSFDEVFDQAYRIGS